MSAWVFVAWIMIRVFIGCYFLTSGYLSLAIDSEVLRSHYDIPHLRWFFKLKADYF